MFTETLSVMPRQNRSREPNSRRSRSSGRSRSRHRDHGHPQVVRSSSSRTRFRLKYKEKNFLAAICSVTVIVILCTALSEPRWISLRGGGCTLNNDPLISLGIPQFFYPGNFLVMESYDDKPTHIIYKFGSASDKNMDNCVTQKAVLLLKSMIVFMFLAIICSIASFLMDLTGPMQRALKILRRNAIPSIVTVILCVIVNLLCYWVTTEVSRLQKITKVHPGSKVTVSFDISFYLVTAAGGVAVLGTACNCLRRYPIYEESQVELLDDYDGMDSIIPAPPAGPEVAQMSNLPPPPPYSP